MYILHKTFVYYIEWQGECGFALNKRSLVCLYHSLASLAFIN